MKLTKKERTIKYVVFCALIILAALLQNVSGLWFEIGGARCFFLVFMPIILGIGEDERTSALFGLLAGLLWDSVSLQHMGYNAVFLMIVCFVSSAFVTYLLRSTYFVRMFFCVLASFLYVLFYWLFFVLAKGGDGAAASFGYFYIPCFVYTAAMSFIIDPVLMFIVRRLNKEQRIRN